MIAVGVHAHPTLRLGARPKADKPCLRFGEFLTGVLPAHPVAVDDTHAVTFGLDRNDQFGVCVPTAVDNYLRMTTRLLAGRQRSQGWPTIKAWYRTQNPAFDENDPGGPGDGGMVVQDFLAYLVKAGVILGFAALDTRNEEQVKAAEFLLLGTVEAVDLQLAQQDQSTWDYAPSGEWGGHCIMVPRYSTAGETCISWATQYPMTPKFLATQRSEAYAVITADHWKHPSFRAGLDRAKFAAAVEQITGRPFGRTSA